MKLEYARKAISSLGCDVVKTVPFILPDEEAERALCCRNAQIALYAENVSASRRYDYQKATIFRTERGSKMNIIYRKAELNDIPKLNPLLAQLSDAMADRRKWRKR